MSFAVQADRSSSSDRDFILDAIRHYFMAGDMGSSTELRQAFHPDAMMFWVSSEGVLQSRSQSQWCELLDKAAPPAPALRRHVQWIDLSGSMAVAGLLSQFPQYQFQDYVLLARASGRWQIVAKVFQRVEGEGGVLHSGSAATDDRRAEILDVLAAVFRATDTYDADLLSQSYHPRATCAEVVEDQLVMLALPEWQAQWREKRVAGELNIAARSIAKLESCGDVAVVTMVHDNGSFPVSEYALMLKVEGAWKVMALTCAR